MSIVRDRGPGNAVSADLSAREMFAVLDRADRREAELKRQRVVCERDFLSFVKLLWPVVEPVTKLVDGWPLRLLCDVFTAIEAGHIKRIIINVPPGFSKSYCTNVFFPAWLWGPRNRPGERFLAASYAGALAERDNGGDVGRFSRLINSVEYRTLWGHRFKVVKDNAGLVENDKTGSKRVVTMSGGATTGFRGDFILIDDANNPLDVESDIVRATTNTWLREVMPSRLNHAERSVIISIQQRTHEDDATGTLAKFGEYDWCCVPMHFDPMRIFPVTLERGRDGEPVRQWMDPRALDASSGRRLDGLFTDARGKLQLKPGSPMALAEGELAWPERFSAEACDKLRHALGDHAYAGQYQQEPSIRGGAIIRRDWWGVHQGELPELGTVIAALDTAIEEGVKNDFNALVTFGAYPGLDGEPRLILTSAARWRCQLAELVKNVEEICRYRKVDYLLIERRTRGKDVHDEIIRLFGTSTWQTILIDVVATKVARLKAVSHLFSGDMLRDPTTGIEFYTGGVISAPDRMWADAVIEEVAAFPKGSHDDYVDAVSLALGFIRRNGVVLRRQEWDIQETEKKQWRKPLSVPYAI